MTPDRSPGRPPLGVPPLDQAAVRRALRGAGLRARHSLSQNFLVDLDVLEGILAEAAPAPGRRILEIGPGLGILTGGLLGAGASVVAIELDHGLASRLRVELADAIARGEADPGAPGALILVEADALDVDLAAHVAPPFDVVANLPYHITSPVLHLMLGEPPRPERLVLMVQREVAERVAAPPGEMSYLSVFVQYHASVRIAIDVPRAAFEPEPDVDSAVIVLEPHEPASRPASTAGAGTERAATGTGRAVDARPLTPESEGDLWRLVQAAFHERRKMIRNVLARQLPVPGARLDEALRAAGIAGDRRPQTLGVGEWLALREALGPLPPDRRGTGAGQRRASSRQGMAGRQAKGGAR